MNSATSESDNPFATRWVRPGAIAFQFSEPTNLHWMVERLRGLGWSGQIVGPHGSGKSTLLATLIPALEAAGRQPCGFRVCPGDRHVSINSAVPPETEWNRPHSDPRAWRDKALRGATWTTATQVLVDGYEQLSRLGRFRLQRAVRRAGCGLLVTAHRSVGLPNLARLRPDLARVVQIVDTLVERDCEIIGHDDIAASFAVNQTNVRAILFDLYDLYERRTRPVRMNR
jgi:hypothetical protein